MLKEKITYTHIIHNVQSTELYTSTRIDIAYWVLFAERADITSIK